MVIEFGARHVYGSGCFDLVWWCGFEVVGENFCCVGVGVDGEG